MNTRSMCANRAAARPPARPSGLELAVLGYVDWFNHRRLHGEIGMIPPAEAETAYYRQIDPATMAEVKESSLH